MFGKQIEFPPEQRTAGLRAGHDRDLDRLHHHRVVIVSTDWGVTTRPCLTPRMGVALRLPEWAVACAPWQVAQLKR